MATSRIGTSFFLWCHGFYLLPMFAAIVAMPLLIVRLAFHRTRRKAFLNLVVATLLVCCCLAGALLGIQVRMAAMRHLAQRSRPLMEEIKKSKSDPSGPPNILEILVPHKIPDTPSTGKMAFPELEYYKAKKEKTELRGNKRKTSRLTTSTPS